MSRKSWVDKIKDTFIEDTKGPTWTHNPNLPSATSVATSITSAASVSISSGEVGAPVKADASALAKLEATIKQSGGQVYSLFMDQYENLHDVISDEVTRFKAALKTSRTTADQVVGAVDQLLKLMEAEAAKAAQSFEEGKNKIETAAKEAVAAADNLIKSKEDQIKTITEQIASLRAKYETDVQQFQADRQRLENERAGYLAAHAQVVERLSDQKSKLEKT